MVAWFPFPVSLELLEGLTGEKLKRSKGDASSWTTSYPLPTALQPHWPETGIGES